MKTFEYRLYVKKEQSQLLMQCLHESRIIYNSMIEAVKQQYEAKGTFPSKYDLTAQFKGRGGEHVPATTVQALADRLSKSLKRFLAAKEHGLKIGFPRFKGPHRWHSIQLRQYGKDCSLHEDGKHFIVPAKLGKSLKINMHRSLEGTPKTAYLVLRADGHWYALIVCETEPQQEHLPSSCEHPPIGIDVGLKSFLTDSEGRTIENPRYYRISQKTLRRKQRTLCRRKKGSHRRKKAAKSVAKTHLKIKRQRRDFLFKTAKPYAEQYHLICVEHLNVKGMVKNHALAKSIHDASWSMFLDMLEAKAASAGHQVIRVNPRFTSQTCFQCGEVVQKTLSVRTHICPHCGFVADRDVNAAKNILQAGAPPSGANVHQGVPRFLRSPRLEP